MGSDGSPLTLDLIKLIQITLLLASFQPFSLPAAPSLKTQGPPPTHKHPLYILSWVSTRSLPPQCLPGGCEALFVTIEASFLGSQCWLWDVRTNSKSISEHQELFSEARLPLLYSNVIRVLLTFWGHSPCKLTISEYAVLIRHPKKKKRSIMENSLTLSSCFSPALRASSVLYKSLLNLYGRHTCHHHER